MAELLLLPPPSSLLPDRKIRQGRNNAEEKRSKEGGGNSSSSTGVEGRNNAAAQLIMQRRKCIPPTPLSYIARGMKEREIESLRQTIWRHSLTHVRPVPVQADLAQNCVNVKFHNFATKIREIVSNGYSVFGPCRTRDGWHIK
jgi:hypothetical protein